jgi:1,2-diacylglycerol-3-alpha-glucose alpha-1,2-galactosyltransferase
MQVNFYVEDLLFFKYIGCATVARTLYKELVGSDDVEITWKKRDKHMDLVHYHSFGPFALFNRRINRGKNLLTAHSTPRINEGNIALTKVINRKYPKIYREFDHIITISEPCHREVTEMVPDMPVTLIPNGVNRQQFQRDDEKRVLFRERYNIPEDAEVVLSVAQLTPRKGLYDFLALSRICPDKVFVWVGGFPYGALSKDYRKIKFLKRKCGQNVLFTGYVDEIVKAYSAADVFIMPSYAETFGLVILEALSCGLPVIARDIPEFHDIFDKRILFFDKRETAASLLEDRGALQACASRARDYSGQFDIRDIGQRHLKLYRELVNE